MYNNGTRPFWVIHGVPALGPMVMTGTYTAPTVFDVFGEPIFGNPTFGKPTFGGTPVNR
jgi:hypothetical protein